jgi:hypothetical protein
VSDCEVAETTLTECDAFWVNSRHDFGGDRIYADRHFTGVRVKQKFQKLDVEKIRRLKVHKLPTLDYSWRRNAYVSRIPSLETSASNTSTNSMMDPVALQKETPQVREAIIAKSKRIAIAYNKGAYQYVSDETDPASLGSGERLRR